VLKKGEGAILTRKKRKLEGAPEIGRIASGGGVLRPVTSWLRFKEEKGAVNSGKGVSGESGPKKVLCKRHLPVEKEKGKTVRSGLV